MYHGQFLQDYFVDKLLNIDNGFFLDIGAGISDLDSSSCPIHVMSNTYFLEKERNWTGIAIDYDATYIRRAKEIRKCQMVCADLMKTNINEILETFSCSKYINYLSFDIDNAQQKVLDELDFSTYKFQIITYEHNVFRGKAKEQKESRKKIEGFGYNLLFGDVGINLYEPVEDWYVNDDLFKKYDYIYNEHITLDEMVNELLCI